MKKLSEAFWSIPWGVISWVVLFISWVLAEAETRAVRTELDLTRKHLEVMTDTADRAISQLTAAEEVCTTPVAPGPHDWNAFIEALIFVESSGRPDAVGDDSLAVGVLQIQPCVVDDLFIAGYDYTLDDRYDRQKSIEMFNAYQRIYNPERNIERAIHLHNPRAGVKYRDRIIEKMNELKP